MASKVQPPPLKPFTLSTLPPDTWYRVHPYDAITGKYTPDAYNASGLGNARFSPLRRPDNNEVIPTIYAADTHRGAIAEIVLHDVPTPSTGYQHDLERDRTSDLHMSAVGLPRLKVVNLKSTGMKAAGMLESALFDGDKADYDRTRTWALWIWENMPDAQGLLWMSKQDSESRAVMLFGDRVKEPIIDLKQSQHVINYEDVIVELLDEMGATIAPSL